METAVTETIINEETNFFGQISEYAGTQIQEDHQLIQNPASQLRQPAATKPERQFKLAALETKHAEQIARLHIEGISTGFISSLGIDFVTALYEAIIQDKASFGFVTEDDKVLGFVAFTTNLGKLYKSVILKKGLRFAFILAGKMLSLQRIKKVFETLFYPSRIKKMNLPSAELLSIVVAPQARRKGIAMQLVRKGLRCYQKGGIDKVKVLVGADNEPANKLYLKCGFKLARQIDNHGIRSNIYVATTAKQDRISKPPTSQMRQSRPLAKLAGRLKSAAAVF
jgi:ribosomal protein S18 acetylase RimI-like enzyme